MSGFERQIEEARRKAEEADGPATTQLYEHHAELLTEVDEVLDAQRDLVERKNESLEALAGLVVSFYRKHGDDLDGEAREDLSTITVAAQQVIEQVQSESDPLATEAFGEVGTVGDQGVEADDDVDDRDDSDDGAEEASDADGVADDSDGGVPGDLADDAVTGDPEDPGVGE